MFLNDRFLHNQAFAYQFTYPDEAWARVFYWLIPIPFDFLDGSHSISKYANPPQEEQDEEYAG